MRYVGRNNSPVHNYGAVIVTMSLWEFITDHLMNTDSAKRPPTLSPSEPSWAMSPPESGYCSVYNDHHWLLLLSQKTDTYFIVPRKVEGWVNIGTAVMVYSPCPKLYIAAVFVMNTQSFTVGFEPGQPSMLPLDHWDLQADFEVN